MKKIFFGAVIAAILSASTSTASAQEPKTKLRPNQTLLLYPQGQSVNEGIAGGPIESNGLSGDETLTETGNLGNISDNARIDLYFPKKPNGQMVIVCPGGGYKYVSSFNEGVYVAEWMLARGITVCVVKYRMPNGHWRVPLNDVQNAFRYCRAHAAEWKINQIGVMGFSAGGHLAASASTLFKDEITRPDFSVLVYPVITIHRPLTHNGTRANLLGKDAVWKDRNKLVDEYEQAQREWDRLKEIYSLQNMVNANTPPTYIVLCEDDKTVPAENSLMYYQQLLKFKVPSEMHIFPTGGHGWGFSSEKYVGKGNDKFSYARPYFEQTLERWLSAQRSR
ncbi:MAG: alpha/beta hydrolase [Bacteroidaceae bacterium]|nr:alpha/beta hydrolase [Bacteroidales bacterium]MCF0185562.1 alpha/beta hydrolase [Bacteroidaceae bacterium]